MIRVVLPTHLKTLARVSGEVEIEPAAPTLGSALTALEHRFPVLQGSIRDHVTLKRRDFVRYYACEQDLSLEPPDTPLPEPVLQGREPLMIVGALAGG
jgi:hypothetical protein